MMHSILLTLLATATLPAPALPPAPARVMRADPVIKVWTDWEEYSRGQTATAHIRTREDGYVIVLQADVDGRVRVVFPLDPGDDNFVRGGHDLELAGRGGKGSFFIDGPPGMAAVYAAVSAVPFRFTDFVKGDHWDYGSIYDKSLESDFESGFTAIVDRMSAGHFDYDIYRYRVEGQGSYASADSYSGPTYIGSPCWVAPYDAFCGGPTYIPGPLYGAAYPWGYGWGPSFGFGYSMGYGWGVGISFGMPYYGYDPYYGYGYPYYGYGYGYPYGYGSFYNPYYGGYYHGYSTGHPYYPGYAAKPGNPGGVGVTGVGYRPRAGVPVTGGGIGGIGYRGSTGTQAGTLGLTGVERRTPTGRGSGWTLGRPSASRPTVNTDPRRNDGGKSGGYNGGNNGRGNTAGPSGNGGQPAARAPRNDPPPRYEPGTRSEPRGRGEPAGRGASPGGTPARAPSGSPQGGGNRTPSAPPAGHAPSAPAPRSNPSPPASRPSSPPSHSGGGGGGHRVP